MWDVKTGDLLVYIGPAFQITEADIKRLAPLKKNEVYTVRDIGTLAGHVWVRLEEIHWPLEPGATAESAYNIKCFRPVSRLRSEEFRKLVSPIDRLEEVL